MVPTTPQPKEYIKNYTDYIETIGIEHVYIHFISLDFSVNSNEESIHDHPTNMFSSMIHEQIILKNVILRSAGCPFEIIRLKTDICDYLLQIFYDSSAQVSIYNYKCTLLVVNS